MPRIDIHRQMRCSCCSDVAIEAFDRRRFMQLAGGAGAAALLNPLVALAAEGDYEAMVLGCIDPRMQEPMRNYTVEHFAAHCQCGSPRCRDRITGWKDLPSERKADYRGFVAPYLTDIDDQDAAERVGHLVRIEPGSPHQAGQVLNVAGVVTG